MKQIRFFAGGCSSVFGNFAPGDLLRCSDAEARHFVEEAHCARYVQPEAEVTPGPQALVPAPKPRTRKGVL
jgi:hypothetical protein